MESYTIPKYIMPKILESYVEMDNQLPSIIVHPFYLSKGEEKEDYFKEYEERLAKTMSSLKNNVVLVENRGNIGKSKRRLKKYGYNGKIHAITSMPKGPKPLKGWEYLFENLRKNFDDNFFYVFGMLFFPEPNPNERGCVGKLEQNIRDNGFRSEIIYDLTL